MTTMITNDRFPRTRTLLVCACLLAPGACDEQGSSQTTTPSGPTGKADDGKQGCDAQDAAAVNPGLCEIGIGFAWDGESCVFLSGCDCEGADCGDLSMSMEACEDRHVSCDPGASCPDEDALIEMARARVTDDAFQREPAVASAGDLDGDDVEDAFVLPGTGSAANDDVAIYLSGSTGCAETFAGLFSGVDATVTEDGGENNGALDLAVRSSGGNCLQVVTRYVFDGEEYRAAEELERLDLCGGPEGSSCEDCAIDFEVCMDIEADAATCTSELEACEASAKEATGETC